MELPVRIGLDLDGVIIDHHDSKCRLAADFGLALEPWQTNTNVIKEFMPLEAYRALQDRLYTSLTPTAPPVRRALETLAALPAEFYIVSARTPVSIRFAQDWLGQHRLYDLIPAERVFFCGTAEDKRVYCERLGLHAFMDDKLSVLQLLPRHVHRILFDEDKIHERLNLGEAVHVAETWDDFRAMISG